MKNIYGCDTGIASLIFANRQGFTQLNPAGISPEQLQVLILAVQLRMKQKGETDDFC